MKNTEMDNMLNSAAIICGHIAEGKESIRYAKRTEPVEPEDSGWQFLCGTNQEENENDANVWLISEVLKFDPSLECFILSPVGTELFKDNDNTWKEM
jgi:hypothetical protein